MRIMAFMNELSCECTKSELDLFAVPPTQTSIQDARWVEYQPLISILGNAPIEFDFIGSGEDYMDLANVLLHVRTTVVKITMKTWLQLSPRHPSIYCYTAFSVRWTSP